MLFPSLTTQQLPAATRKELARIAKLDAQLVAIVKEFMILGPLSWPKSAMQQFLKSVERKAIKLPIIEYPTLDYRETIRQLEKYIKNLGNSEHPAFCFLRDTAESYLDAYRILQGAGTTDVTTFSRKLYGSPKDKPVGYPRRNIDMALRLMAIVDKYNFTVPEDPLIYSASQFKAALHRQIIKRIPRAHDPIDIFIDDAMSARASAGSNYVKLRKGARFSQADLDQLLHHEVMIHTLTYMNGRKQPILTTLGYSAPRTTATQEGLAVFAEYINRSIDLVRLKRIALRIKAINLAEKGADLVNLFNFYRSHGQNNEESYYSAMRIFRGGTPKGGIVFYKDNVYLSGLLEVTHFLKQAMRQGMIYGEGLLFCGKLTTADIARLAPLVQCGGVVAPAYMPDWAEQASTLSAHLACNDLAEYLQS